MDVCRKSVCGVLLRGGLILVALFLGAMPLQALSVGVSSIDARVGLLWLGNPPISAGGEGAPSPLLNDVGVSVPLSFGGPVSIAPEIDFLGTQYQLTSSGSKSVPTQIETADSVWLLTVLLDPEVRYAFTLNKTLDLGIAAAPAFFLHVPVAAWGNGAEETDSITGYFYSEGRFFYPEIGAYLTWKALPSLALEIRLRSFFPIFHIWDGESDPFYDQMMIDGTIGLRFYM